MHKRERAFQGSQKKEGRNRGQRCGEGASEPVIVRNQGGPPIRDLRLENIEVVIRGKELVKDCALTPTRGSRYGLVGRNGTVKTSLLRVLSGREDIIQLGIPLIYIASRSARHRTYQVISLIGHPFSWAYLITSKCPSWAAL